MTKIWIVDAFTDKAYSGNPAAVMVVSEFPPEKTCQAIAAEMNLSETAFVKCLDTDYFHIRWFTPTTEVKLCGHATLASAQILFTEQLTQSNTIRFDSLSGVLNVTQDAAGLILDFPLQKIGESLNLSEFEDLLDLKGNILNVVQAYDDVIVELRDVATLHAFKPNLEQIKQLPCRGIILTVANQGQYDFISRFFAPRVGVVEDPVTGSAHCKLAHYWSQKLNKTHLYAFQASARGGKLELIVKNERVLLKGNAVKIMAGEWLIPVA
ncbi:MAG: PhzF family phenazine biosynthesis protein [Legionellales bacterium]|nr:PhzF family phenazine biosynthesis protein [Legionellales bacterium]